jgi:8-oxo-dGTP diphosphatase
MLEFKTPFVAVDAVIRTEDNKIVLIERKFEPLGLALPGGFVECGESCEDAVKREVMEETGLTFYIDKLIGVYSNPRRDPRAHIISIAYSGEGYGTLSAGDDAKGINTININELDPMIFRNEMNFVFDHSRILMDYLNKLFIAGGL